MDAVSGVICVGSRIPWITMVCVFLSTDTMVKVLSALLVSWTKVSPLLVAALFFCSQVVAFGSMLFGVDQV